MSVSETCVCGDVLDEHDWEDAFGPCTVEGRDCIAYEEDEDAW